VALPQSRLTLSLRCRFVPKVAPSAPAGVASRRSRRGKSDRRGSGGSAPSLHNGFYVFASQPKGLHKRALCKVRPQGGLVASAFTRTASAPRRSMAAQRLEELCPSPPRAREGLRCRFASLHAAERSRVWGSFALFQSWPGRMVGNRAPVALGLPPIVRPASWRVARSPLAALRPHPPPGKRLKACCCTVG